MIYNNNINNNKKFYDLILYFYFLNTNILLKLEKQNVIIKKQMILKTKSLSILNKIDIIIIT